MIAAPFSLYTDGMNAKTRKVVLGVIVLILLAAGFSLTEVRNAISLASANEPVTAPTAGEWYPVVKVTDGDTLTVNIDGKNQSVRLIGVNTPETVDPRRPVQCFGKEASNAAHVLLDEQSVRLETDPSQGERDAYGRLLAYVFLPAQAGLPDGRMLNEYLIANGYGHEYTFNIPYKYQAAFKAAEIEARAAQKGLWAPGACETIY